MHRLSAVLLPCALFLCAACSGNSDSAVILESADGRLSLTLEDGALPDGVSVRDIRIEPINNIQNTYGYSLLPDGLQLQKPVTMTYQPQAGETGAPMILHESSDKTEFVPAMTVTYESGKTQTTFSISHFSKILAIFYGCDMDVVVTPERVEVGKRGIMTSWIERSAGPTMTLMEVSGTPYQEITFVGVPKVQGGMSTSKKGIVGPSRAELPPAETPMPGTRYDVSQELTCATVGRTSVWQMWDITAYAKVRTYAFDANGPTGKFREEYGTVLCGIGTTAPIECVAAAGSSSSFSSSSSSSSSSTDTQTTTCLIIENEEYPETQFRKGQHAGGCDSWHYHADVPVASLQGSVREDPAPHNCGFGKTHEVPIRACTMDKETRERFEEAAKRR